MKKLVTSLAVIVAIVLLFLNPYLAILVVAFQIVILKEIKPQNHIQW